MRRKERAIQTPQLLNEIIHQSDYLILGLPDTPTPYLVPMNFGYNGSALYCHSAKKGKKIDLIRSHGPHCPVSILWVSHAELYNPGKGAADLTTRYASIMATGYIDEVADPEECLTALQLIVRQVNMDHLPVMPQDAATTAILRITLTSCSGKSNIPELLEREAVSGHS